MAITLRFQSKAAQISQAGTTFNHGLGPAMALVGATTPDEYGLVLVGPTPGAVALYVVGTPTSTSIIVAASGATGTGSVFASVNHTLIK